MRGSGVFGVLCVIAVASGCPGQQRGSSTDGGAGSGGSGGMCVQKELCVQGDHWDAQKCACVAGASAGGGGQAASGTGCVQNRLCLSPLVWSVPQCACVLGTNGVAGTAASAGTSGGAGTSAGAGASGSGGVCVQTQLCARGLHWDPTQCMCVADAASDAGAGTGGTSGGHCVQNQLCIRNSHWDSTLCKCTPDASDSGVPTLDAGAGTGDPCTTAADCHGILPHICATCAAPGGDASFTPISGCAHWACKSGHCETTLCD